MPTNAVKTERDERLWSEARAQAQKQGKGDDYAYIMGIYQRMKKRTGGAKEAGFDAALEAAGIKTASVADWIRVNMLDKPTQQDAALAPLWATGLATGPMMIHEGGTLPWKKGNKGLASLLMAVGLADTGFGVKGVRDMYKEYS